MTTILKSASKKFDHGNCGQFDGPLGVLAHAQGITTFFVFTVWYNKAFIHFDDSEHWLDGDKYDGGINLFQVAVHEIGHILGLDHPDDPTSIMRSDYDLNGNVQLKTDDIRRVESIWS